MNNEIRRKGRRLVPLWLVVVIVLIVGISVYAITITVLPTTYTSLYENNIAPSPVVVSSANVVFIGPNNIEVIVIYKYSAELPQRMGQCNAYHIAFTSILLRKSDYWPYNSRSFRSFDIQFQCSRPDCSISKRYD
ncbi:MAG: hypothetical protein QW292_14395 [Candidatus Parvarchaeota archaeon]